MKRYVVALLMGTMVFGAVYGLAASLGVSSSTLGAGTSAVAACQSGTLTAGYATVYDSSLPGDKVGVVTVTGLDTASTPNCGGKSFRVTVTGPGASNASLGQVSGTTPGSGTSFTADFTSLGVSAASVTGVHIVISG
jgi:hypothetical protein